MTGLRNAEGPVVFTRVGFVRGLRMSLPLVLGLIPFGLVAGVAGQGVGLSLGEITFMSAAVYAGAAQLVALGVWGHPVDLFAVTFAAFVVNLRLALMGPVLAPWLNRLSGWRLYLSLFMMVDHSWALSVKEMNAGYRDSAMFLGCGLSLFVFWVITTALGHLLGTQLQPPQGHPLFFAALAAFISILVMMWRGLGDLMPWAVAGVVSVLVAQIMPGSFWYIVAGALAGSVAGGVRDHRRTQRKPGA